MTPGADNWRTPRRIELDYARKLRKIARQVGELIGGFPDPLADPTVVALIERAMASYSALITPWATAAGSRMLHDVNLQDERSWNTMARTMSRALRRELASAPTGLLLRARLQDQVTLIKSLPLQAGERVHKLALEGLTTGRRAEDIAKEIGASGQVTASRATLIARTEVARTASLLTQTRSESVGSDGYWWETAEDEAVRPSHRRMQGKFVRWSQPPTLDKMTGHAGQFPNCRCFPRPNVPDF